MATQRAVLIRGAPLANSEALSFVLAEALAYFSDYGDQPPPLPENVLSFAPCGVLITEWRGDNRERIGRIEISQPDGRIVYDKAWSLDGQAIIDESTLTDRGSGTAPMLFGDQGDTPVPLKAVGDRLSPPVPPPPGGRVFNVSISETGNATESVDAGIQRPVITGDLNIELEGVSAIASTGSVSINEEPDRLDATGFVIEPIWNVAGSDAIFRIDQAQNELVAIREFLLGLRAYQSTNLMGHNNPPDSAEPPDVDLEALDAAVQALRVLRLLLSQPQPDFEVVKLIFSVLNAALRGVLKITLWLGRFSKDAITTILSSTFGQSFQKSAGTVLGGAAATALLAAMAGVGPDALPKVIEFLKAVATAAGHSF